MPGADAAIRGVLQAQESAWNRGDLEGFMEGYWQSDSLRFVSGGNVRYGWQATLEAYRRGYPDRATMGTLSFTVLDVHLVGRDDAYVLGRWTLAREASFEPAAGLFTLLFHRFPAGWRILHDHTSSAR